MTTTPPRTMDQQLTWSMYQTLLDTPNWHDECDGFTARSAGYAHSGFLTAYLHWQGINILWRRGPKRAWAPGDSLFWQGGQGHTTIVADNPAHCYSTDLNFDGKSDPAAHGKIHLIPITLVHDAWGLPFLGSVDRAHAWPKATGLTTLPPLHLSGWPVVSLAAVTDAIRTNQPSRHIDLMKRGLATMGLVPLDVQSPTWAHWTSSTQTAWERARTRSSYRGLTCLRYIGCHGRFVATA